ncbi:4'-phosphopantetheinyl transferase superfamily protein [Peribacillus simplex]|uniref:4'-phosphopantetheinyl transferase superfamily protein n=1 Tax=Peribacillus simplex TaxID=1478 RepID=UPI0019234A68|nr:4'-phosphopantetheinyl transferase superfamily protein [Peribacillus simplex]MBD8591214.1 4'-phosphopantetheinyl transferase superfamily protein [Peribacillus simplex]
MKDFYQLTFSDLGIICFVVRAPIEKLNWLTNEESVSWVFRIYRRKRIDWLSSRIAAKAAAIKWLEINYKLELLPKLINIFNADSGMPHLKWPLDIRTPNLSISHKNDIGVASVSGTNIFHGCDIEFIKERQPGFSTYFLSSYEKELWFKNEVKVNNEIVEKKCIETMLWSAKESIIKAILSTETSMGNINMVHIFLKPIKQDYNNLPQFSFSYKNFQGIGKWVFIKDYVVTLSLLD